MKTEIKKYLFRCDSCREEETIEGSSMPKNWTIEYCYDCGLTNYTTEIHLCPDCSKKDNDNE